MGNMMECQLSLGGESIPSASEGRPTRRKPAPQTNNFQEIQEIPISLLLCRYGWRGLHSKTGTYENDA